MNHGPDAPERPDDGPRVPRADRPPVAPARPPVGGTGFASAMDLGAPPAALRASVVLWLAGAVAALAAVALLWSQQAAIRGRLAAVATAQDPAVTADVVVESARLAFLAAAGSVALVAVVHAVLAVLLRRGRAWARPVLVITGVLGVVVALAVQDLVATPARAAVEDPARVALLVHAVLVVAALGAVLGRSTGGWLRRAVALRR